MFVSDHGAWLDEFDISRCHMCICLYTDLTNNLFVLLLQVFQDTYPTETEEVGRDEQAIIKKPQLSDGNYFPVSLLTGR